MTALRMPRRLLSWLDIEKKEDDEDDAERSEHDLHLPARTTDQ